MEQYIDIQWEKVLFQLLHDGNEEASQFWEVVSIELCYFANDYYRELSYKPKNFGDLIGLEHHYFHVIVV